MRAFHYIYGELDTADVSALFYTMVEMAKAHNINIYKYLNYVLECRPYEGMTDEQFEKLAPWKPEVIEKCSGAM